MLVWELVWVWVAKAMGGRKKYTSLQEKPSNINTFESRPLILSLPNPCPCLIPAPAPAKARRSVEHVSGQASPQQGQEPRANSADEAIDPVLG